MGIPFSGATGRIKPRDRMAQSREALRPMPHRGNRPMYEKDVIVTTKYGQMPTFVACPDAPGQYPAIIFYMDAPGIREELRNMTRRIAKQGYFAVLPDMYYRLGTLRFDVNRRDDEMFQCMRAAMNSLTNALVMDDTAGLLGFIEIGRA